MNRTLFHFFTLILTQLVLILLLLFKILFIYDCSSEHPFKSLCMYVRCWGDNPLPPKRSIVSPVLAGLLVRFLLESGGYRKASD